MWVYSQKSGKLYDSRMQLVATGYAGAGEGKNNPDKQHVKNTGPLPVGLYRIEAPREGTDMGPLAIPLTPDPGNEMWDRSGFYIHGDSIAAPGTASEGCPIFHRPEREKIVRSDDKWLVVMRDV
jgi:hypothetical protein